MSHPVSEGVDDIEIGEWRRVSPLSIIAQGIRSLKSLIIPIGFVLFGASSQSSEFSVIATYAVPILLAVLALNLVPPWLGWLRLRYRVGESDVRLEQGLISRSARSVPYDRIQDVSLEQKLIPRMLGLVEVRFETGAGGKDELKLAYVSEAEGERLREVVRALVEGAEDVVAAPVEGVPAEVVTEGRLLFAMGQGRLVTYGLFSFSLVIFAVLIGAAQQFEFLLPYDVWDYVGDWFEDKRYADAGSYLETYDTGARIMAVLYLIASVIVVGLASGVVKTFVRDWGFRLDRTAKGFRRRRGPADQDRRGDACPPGAGAGAFHRNRAPPVRLVRPVLHQSGAGFGRRQSRCRAVRAAGGDRADCAGSGVQPARRKRAMAQAQPNYYFDRAVMSACSSRYRACIGFTAAAVFSRMNSCRGWLLIVAARAWPSSASIAARRVFPVALRSPRARSRAGALAARLAGAANAGGEPGEAAFGRDCAGAAGALARLLRPAVRAGGREYGLQGAGAGRCAEACALPCSTASLRSISPDRPPQIGLPR